MNYSQNYNEIDYDVMIRKPNDVIKFTSNPIIMMRTRRMHMVYKYACTSHGQIEVGGIFFNPKSGYG